ncbi:DegT/DnrJ/EryC1/StrS family aminotransferase [Celeribacter sp.]|uniref:DegT/DnrJ/EryC1/StrS family aminotransferase n=1 Tax=Celeribacter sp. TaxID=1890673 RepID=UPI003A8ED47F
MPNTEPVPFFIPFTDSTEANAVLDTIQSHWLTSGPRCRKFEEALAAYVGPGVEVVTVNSATAGLHLALDAVGIGPGDEVLLPTLTFTATAEVVRYLGAVPVFVDVDPQTLNIDLAAAEAKVTNKSRAIMPVHFAGLPCNMNELGDLAARHNLHLIEDAAHALSASQGDKRIGAFESAATVFSFYANKTITTGEGGAVATRDPDLAKRMRVMRTHGIDRDVSERFRTSSWQYDVIAPGFKYNMTDIAAAMGIEQLKKADTARDLRHARAVSYLERLADLPLYLPAPGPNEDAHAWHIFPIRVKREAPVSRNELAAAFSKAKIGFSVHYRPLHQMSYWAEKFVSPQDSFPVADEHFDTTLSLPLFPGMTDAQQDRVVEVLRNCLKG